MSDIVESVTSVAALAAIASPTSGLVILLAERQRFGPYMFSTGDYSAHVAADPEGAAYVESGSVASTTGAWVRQDPHNDLSVEAFGATGDGFNDDLPALKKARDFQKALVAQDVQWRLFGRAGATYFVGTFGDSAALNLNYDHAYWDLNGATILYEQGIAAGVFFIGNENYETGVDDYVPGPITIRGGTIDFDKGAQFCKGVFCRYPARDITIEDMIFRQSAIADGATPGSGDQWAINFENYTPLNLEGIYTDAADANARLHNVLVRNCQVYDTMQLTAGAGRGINVLRILDNYIFEPRANGIAITGLSPVIRLDDVTVSRNTVVRALNHAIYINCDAVSNQFDLRVEKITGFQHYLRNCVVTDNISEDCGGALCIGHYVQGGHNILIDDNIITNHSGSETVTRTDGLTVTPADQIRSQGLLGYWAIDYHGGTDPVIAASAFDATTELITLTAHKLPTGCGVLITPERSATMPAGIAAGVPYWVKAESANTFSLWESIDERTGTPINQVNIGAGASGNFTVSFTSIIRRMTIGSGNILSGSDGCFLASIRESTINGRLGTNFRFGQMADVEIGAKFHGAMRNMLGGTLRVVFTPEAEFRMRSTALSTDQYIVRLADATDYNLNYDVEFSGCRVIVEGAAALSAVYPQYFLRDQVTAANRRGRGWSASNVMFTVSGVNFSGFGAANPDNCWRMVSDGAPQSGTECFGGGRIGMRFRYRRSGDLGSIAAGSTATVDITCTGLRAADDGKLSIMVRPLTNKADFVSLTLSAYISADHTIRVTAFNPTTGAINPASSEFLFEIEGYHT